MTALTNSTTPKTMNKLIKFLALAVVLAVFSGCASGPKFAQMQSSIPPLGADQGRIFIYRKGVMTGAAVQPEVKLNGDNVSVAKPGGFVYLDRTAGNYQISTSTEVKRTLSIALEKGQTRYVRLNIAMGFFVGHVFPELVETAVGEKEIKKCKFIGAAAPKQ